MDGEVAEGQPEGLDGYGSLAFTLRSVSLCNLRIDTTRYRAEFEARLACWGAFRQLGAGVETSGSCLSFDH